jgi:hypothetical protein
MRGALVGVDRSVSNGGDNHNLLYNDMVIYPDRAGGESYAMHTVIRAD